MVQKRPFDGEEMLEMSFKHPKHSGPSNQLVPFPESVFPDDDCHTNAPKTSENGWTQGSCEDSEKLEGEVFDELPRGAAYSETSFPGVGIPASSWVTSSTTEEDIHLEPPFHLALYPEYFSPDRPLRTLTRHEDIYSILLEHSPRKPVSIGADYQADVPPWDFSSAIKDSNFTAGDRDDDDDDDDEKRLLGTCIIPMPEIELSSDDGDVGKGRTDCYCEERGSMRCVRKHIKEERENLLKLFGPEKFAELGFTEMGEQVAERWSAEEEQLFHEVVFNNPASLDKNFWNYLSIVFPSRTKKEIVSYYFNVFMLRKRAEQNRNHLLSADSDNDEWQGSDGNEIATHDDDGDSVAESPVCQDHTDFNNCNGHNSEDYDDEYAADETHAANGAVDFAKRNTIDDHDSEYDPVEMHHSNGSLSQVKPVWQDQCDEKAVDDSSCTSFDMRVASQETKVKTGNGDHWCGNYNGVSNGYNQGYVLEHCDAEVWDSGFVSCSNNKIDFLPTCSMIEEVFGDGRRQDMRRA